MKETPEISINKLAEFVNASLSRKHSILRTIKNDDIEAASQKNRYSTAKSSIRIYLADEKHDLKIFEQKRRQLLSKKTESAHQKNNQKNSLLAIKMLEQTAQVELVPYLKFKSQKGYQKNKEI